MHSNYIMSFKMYISITTVEKILFSRLCSIYRESQCFFFPFFLLQQSIFDYFMKQKDVWLDDLNNSSFSAPPDLSVISVHSNNEQHEGLPVKEQACALREKKPLTFPHCFSPITATNSSTASLSFNSMFIKEHFRPHTTMFAIVSLII